LKVRFQLTTVPERVIISDFDKPSFSNKTQKLEIFPRLRTKYTEWSKYVLVGLVKLQPSSNITYPEHLNLYEEP
jgi:hypothetical protein